MAFDSLDPVQIQTMLCQVIKHNVSLIMNEDTLRNVGSTAQVDVIQQYGQCAARQYQAHIETLIATTDCNFSVTKYETWFDEFKDIYFPAWAKTRWPIKKNSIIVPVRAMFPDLNVNGRPPVFNLLVYPGETRRSTEYSPHLKTKKQTSYIDFTAE